MNGRGNTHYFISKIKNSWFFRIVAEGISKSFGLVAIIRLTTKIVEQGFLLLRMPITRIRNIRFYIDTSIWLRIIMPQTYIRNKLKIQAFMAQIIKQYQDISLKKINVVASYMKLLLRPAPVIRFRTRLVANPIVGQYVRLAAIDPMILADIDSNTLEDTETVIL